MCVVEQKPLVIAHRGASGYRPEHSVAAYELAFALGADAIEPDLVPTRDGVLVLRHENEISKTTDVATRHEFADRRTTKTIDGKRVTGWFTEDFTWAEFSRLRLVERLPHIRPRNAAFDGWYAPLRLRDLLAMLDAASAKAHSAIRLVAELKHATYFESIGLPLDELFAAEIEGSASSQNLVVEAFEHDVLARLRARGVPGRYVFLVEDSGAPADLVARHGDRARSFRDHLTDSSLAELARTVHGVSVNKHLLLETDAQGNLRGPNDLVDRAHAAGLEIFCWTLRAENPFLASNLRRGPARRDFGDWRTEFYTIMRTGIDGVFADQPDLAVAVRALL